MNKYVRTLITASSVLLFTTAIAQNTWLQKGNVGTTGRKYAAAFAIGTRGYIATGSTSGGFVNDLWQYDQGSGTWTQKANFGGTARFAAVGFAIGSFGYVGSGSDIGGLKADFYKYDTTGNAWTGIAAYAGGARRSASAFATSTTGYVGLGFDNSNPLQSFYSYDPVGNSWTSITAFPGLGRYSAVAAQAGGKGYVGTGVSGVSSFYQDWYEYDPAGNSWTVKTDFGGGMRFEAMAFATNGKVYVGTGTDNNNFQKYDCYEFDPVGNAWTQRADVTAFTNRRTGAVGFAIGSFGYCATGLGPNGNTMDTWEYTPLSVGIDETNSNNLATVYPNPCQGKITLAYQQLKNISAEFVLRNASGKEVSRHTLPENSKSFTVEEPLLENGIYFYQIISGDKTVSAGKILVAK